MLIRFSSIYENALHQCLCRRCLYRTKYPYTTYSLNAFFNIAFPLHRSLTQSNEVNIKIALYMLLQSVRYHLESMALLHMDQSGWVYGFPINNQVFSLVGYSNLFVKRVIAMFVSLVNKPSLVLHQFTSIHPSVYLPESSISVAAWIWVLDRNF